MDCTGKSSPSLGLNWGKHSLEPVLTGPPITQSLCFELFPLKIHSVQEKSIIVLL